MNGFSFPNQNEMKLDNNNNNDEELNRRLKEYKEIFNNNQIANYNYNIFSKNNIQTSENINLTEMEYEYDSYIANLKMKLNQEREERKKKEEEFVLIQHRLIVLKNQENSKILQLKNIKQHIDKIINNRIQSQEKLNEKLTEKRNADKKTNINASLIGTTNSYLNNNNKLLSGSQNKYYNIKLKNTDLKKKEQIQNANELKQILLEKIKKDEEEKKRIEEEIAKIEEEENNLLSQLSHRKIHSQ